MPKHHTDTQTSISLHLLSGRLVVMRPGVSVGERGGGGIASEIPLGETSFSSTVVSWR